MAGLAGVDRDDPSTREALADTPNGQKLKKGPQKGRKTKRIRYIKDPSVTHGNKFIATDQQKKQVAAYVGMGLTLEQMSDLMAVPPSTISKHFRAELQTGRAQANYNVAENLYNIATSPTAKGNVPAAMFWLRTRAGWKDKQIVELTGVDGQPLTSLPSEVVDTRALTFEQRQLLREVIQAAVETGERRAQGLAIEDKSGEG